MQHSDSIIQYFDTVGQDRDSRHLICLAC